MFILSNLTHKYGSRISHICAEDFCTNDKYRDTCGTTESEVDFRITVECILHHDETFVQLLFHLCGIHDTLSYLSLVKSCLYALFNILAETRFDKLRNFFAKNAMAITDWKEVRPSVLTKMWQDQVWILVNFVGIFGAKTCFCSEWKLGHAIVEFFLRRLRSVVWRCLRYRFRCSDFSGDRSSDSIWITAICSLLLICCFSLWYGINLMWVLSLRWLLRILSCLLGLVGFVAGTSLLLTLTYFSELAHSGRLFGLWAISLHVFLTYLQWLRRRRCQFVRGQTSKMLLFGRLRLLIWIIGRIQWCLMLFCTFSSGFWR